MHVAIDLVTLVAFFVTYFLDYPFAGRRHCLLRLLEELECWCGPGIGHAIWHSAGPFPCN